MTITESIRRYLQPGQATADALCEALNLSHTTVSSALLQLFDNGEVTMNSIKINGKPTITTYSLRQP